ncbi:MAG: AraC family transcriptional regulator [Kiritimatiellales bacterium]|nr:AraC family transcriptional regulator [Kiritimatiellales bacterium]
MGSAFPVAADRVVSRPLVQTDFHRHEFFEMLFVVRGSLLNRLKTEEIVLKAGDLLITKPYVQHLLESRQQKRPAVAYCCSFMPQVVDSSIHSLEELKASNSPNKYFFKPFLSLADDGVSAVLLPIPPARRKQVVEIFQRLQKGEGIRSDSHFARIRCDFLNLLACMADGYEQDHSVAQQVGKVFTIPTSRYSEGLHKALNYMHDHIEQPLTLQEMAAMSGVSVSYFCMLFKHATGTTFLNYLTGLRIEQACVLLRDTCDNITDVCYKVGFSDYSHFSRQFKKTTGTTPSEYRKQNQPARRIEMF